MPNTPKPPLLKLSKAENDAAKPTQGLAVAGNLLACVLVGMTLGWGLDWLLGTKPWGLLGGLVMGFAAWLRELWRLLQPPQA